MGITDLVPVVEHGPWAVALALGVPACAKLLAVMITTKGADPKEKPAIIKAVAELFRWRKS